MREDFMDILKESAIQNALLEFDQLEDHDPCKEDRIFTKLGPKILSHQPFDSFCDYVEFLRRIRDKNQEQYERIHKGTPFFILAVLAFDLRNYEKTLYYLDAAIYEDIKNGGTIWRELPAALFYRLSKSGHAATRFTMHIRKLLSAQINRFNDISKLPVIDIDIFIEKFVIKLMESPEYRIIITAFYVFLLESEERLIELRLKSTHGSSLGPIIAHSFSGSLIFESILKYLYPTGDKGKPNKTLNDIFNTTEFKDDFKIKVKTHSDSFQSILKAVKDNSLITAFNTVAKIRNTTGHNLVWDNVFQEAKDYENIVDQIMNALLYLIEKEFLQKAKNEDLLKIGVEKTT